MDKIKVGLELREARELAGHSQGDLAYNLGCDVATVSRWERGKRGPSGIYRRQVRLVYPMIWVDM